MKKQKGINLRVVIFVLLIGIIILSFVYKYVEWSTTRELVSIYNNNWSKELKILSDDGKQASESAETIINLYNMIDNVKYLYEDLFKQYDKVITVMNIGINQSENHLSTLKANKKELDKIKSKLVFFIGKRGNFIKDLVNKLDEYYSLGIKNVNSTLVQGYVFKDYFITEKDYKILQSFVSLVKDDLVNKPSTYFYILSPLEKYSKDDFKLEKEEKIKALYPKSYEGISRTVKYNTSYYSFTRDYVMGDIDSADYKISKLNEDNMNLNFDYQIVFSEGDEEKRELNKQIITTLTDSIKLIKDSKENSPKKDLFGSIGIWSEDVVLCKLYEYKVGYYYNLTKKYPEAKTFDDLIKEINTVAPTTESVDSKFDKSVIKYTNDDKTIKFLCLDKNNNETYTFITIK